MIIRNENRTSARLDDADQDLVHFLTPQNNDSMKVEAPFDKRLTQCDLWNWVLPCSGG
jgi:hypothetical protein